METISPLLSHNKSLSARNVSNQLSMKIKLNNNNNENIKFPYLVD